MSETAVDRVEAFLEHAPPITRRVNPHFFSLATHEQYELWFADVQELARTARQYEELIKELSMMSAGRRILEELE